MGILSGFDYEDACNEAGQGWEYFLRKGDYNTAVFLWIRKANDSNQTGQVIYGKREAFLAFARFYGHDQ